MKNFKIRIAAGSQGVKLYEIAERLGKTDGNFSKMLRKELPQDETERIIGVINEIARGGRCRVN